jgi:hypothetical protein
VYADRALWGSGRMIRGSLVEVLIGSRGRCA